ncbi:MAG: fatty acid cis/trans isomerase [Pseudomonadota bacterium]
MTPRILPLLLLLLLWLNGCGLQPKVSPTEEQSRVEYDLLINLPAEPIDYQETIRPILDRRCVVCHGCYDAPCQLKLSSMEGLRRGASPVKVYDGARIKPMAPTRLFVDAKMPEEWREKGFHGVMHEQGSHADAESNLDDSVIYQMLRLKQLHPQPRVGMLSDEVDVTLDREQTCPTRETVEAYAEEHPLWGMPYGLPNLRDDEYRLLVQWIAQGAPGEDVARSSEIAIPQIERWYRFLNRSDLKHRLAARYIYEHLFQAHIHLAGTGPREFYRLVRSATSSGQPVDEIASLRPYDDPGRQFYYRLVPYQPSVVLKDHNVYEWSDARLQRYKELFIAPDYAVTEFPGYALGIASNPFKTFAQIPLESRYRFLIDDAKYFIEGFIKGPVCRGQVALNVIEEQFWVFFIDPEAKTLGNDSAFVHAQADLLQMPANIDTLNFFSIWTDYWEREKQYLEVREGHFEDVRKRELDKALAYIWDGEGSNPNAALTVFRHFDSASVRHGLQGNYPETAWIIDYPLFERIHYLLVAGFDVYGSVGHQLNTRLYMDFLRMEGEIFFLALLPVEDRRRIRDAWYVGIHAQVDSRFDQPMKWLEVDSVGGYQTDDPQRELYQALESRLGKVAGKLDYINRCGLNECQGEMPQQQELDVDLAMQRLVAVRGEIMEVFPDVSFVRVVNGLNGEDDLAYTLVRNKAYTNLTRMLEDEDRRDRSNDSLTVLKGLEGSYPNFFFVVKREEIEAFVDRFTQITHRKEYEAFVALYGIRRTNQRFWEHADWFHDWSERNGPVVAGIYDLNRYRNR